MPDTPPLPPLSVDDLLRMIGERDVRIEQLARLVERLQADLLRARLSPEGAGES